MTSEADLIIGKKKHVEMPTAQVTLFGRYPDVQDLCDTFADEMGWALDNYTIRQIAAGARDYKQAIDGDTKRLLKTIQKMKKAGLSIASPRSCITIARKQKPEEDLDRYLIGVEDE